MESSQNGYAIVRFEDDTVSEVPVSWLFQQNTMCWWPPSKNVSIFIAKRTTPNDKWSSYKVVVEHFCKSLKVARKKRLTISIIANPKNVAEENGLKKQSRAFDSDHDTSSSEDSNQSTLEKMPVLTYTIAKDGTLTPEFVINDIAMASDVLFDDHNNGNIDSSITSQTSVVLDPNEKNEGDREVEQRGEIETVNINDTDTNKLLMRILKCVTGLKLQIEEIHAILQQRQQVQKPKEFQAVENLLPISDQNGLGAIETFMKNTENYDCLKKYIGGHNLKDNLNRIYKELFSNGFAVGCSWLGLRQNFKISSSTVIHLVKCSNTSIVISTQAVEDFLDVITQMKEFEIISSEWFRHAKQRLQRENKKD